MAKGVNRRDFIKGVAHTAFAQSVLGAAIEKALAIPAARDTGTIRDVEHIVILMQENRSFDHYFGTLAGVRGFADPRVISLPDGAPVWQQRSMAGDVVAPFRFDVGHTRFPIMKSLDHTWASGHLAWNEGRHDRWIDAKTGLTMGHLARGDIPYHFALADAFTVCDSYFCSVLGPTCPNRLYLFTGNVDPPGQGGGPVTGCTDATQIPGGRVFGRAWSTYPEKLEAAGVSWQVYRQGANPRSDDDSDGGMNSLLAFEQYRSASPGQPLYERGVRPRRLETLKRDVLSGHLPQVSWIVPPRLFCEHPKWPPAYGVEYIARILDALTANRAVWSKTVLLVMYDENDGFFDHVVPPVPPFSAEDGLSTVSVEGERCSYDGQPFGLGMRVPMIAISPWSRGASVCSQVFDHTSVIRFIEARFGVREDNISPWRRAVCGDLSSAFDFETPNEGMPERLTFISAAKRLPDEAIFDAYKASLAVKPKPKVPPSFAAPAVEPGWRKARALPYEFAVEDRMEDGRICLKIHNRGAAGAVFYVQDLKRPGSKPRRYTTAAGMSLADAWPFDHGGAYELLLHGANGFVRAFKGSVHSPQLRISTSHIRSVGALDIAIANDDRTSVRVAICDAYSAQTRCHAIAASHADTLREGLGSNGHWYDLMITCGDFVRRFAGHVETGRTSRSDPLLEAYAKTADIEYNRTFNSLKMR